ncbi:MAG: formate--tetrahydrofolate ligase [Bacteroidales bacterium]|jgi:formate--tetrahydrofolate ligase|nr:formate--tetrahydrofolate ligase [Bacteroidales bacterium]MDI9575150.1 formate--tetrahydrofolate ligase [Bacteroidota bacterium]MDD3755734.1 formate--tetrahydrofolate ligase [Bacteroidales bacterium]MDY0400815.1 formate--tetrahydrofolate ligase [Bacteroidales bacterium]HHW60068.1 formate--tetrahydrofolate ligase [Bacteroidales bacterium]
MKQITEIAENLGIQADQLELYGKFKAKLPINLINEEKVKQSKLVLVTAITPTPAGEGKTTTSISLSMALNKIGKKSVVALREPSLGPVFGIKGGATGGGLSQVLPTDDINLLFTGDIPAIERANNLLSALIDNNLQSKNRNLNLDSRTIHWNRVMDMNDRALRDIVIGLGGISNGIPRESSFEITAASEVMAILGMTDSISDLKERLGNIFVGLTWDKKPIFARDLNAQGAMAALLKDAINPNLVQTTEGTPAIIHCGPFANIAQGTNSILATKMAMTYSDVVITEAGFGSDLGAEKFFDIKCQRFGLMPNAVVIVVTIRALKYHGGASKDELFIPNVDLVKKGLENLDKHIENMMMFNFKPIIALNKFDTDSEAEIDIVRQHCKEYGVLMSINEGFNKGSEGAIDLAEKVIESTSYCPNCFKPIYTYDLSIEDKINTICKNIYGAKDVEYSLKARKDLELIKMLNLENSPVCIAKTQYSLSDNPNLRGRPKDFILNIREIEISTGAGFVVPIAGAIMRMPGLPEQPSAEKIDIDIDGKIHGIS